jgi:hypothetical protein
VTTADVSSSRPDCGRDCRYPALRKFVFEQGLLALENKSLNDISIKSIVQRYKAAHPEEDLPNTIHACFQWESLSKAVMANDMTLLTMQRQRAPTRDAPTIQEKLLLKPELEPVVDWCMAWIRETRRAVVTPTHKAMLRAWEDEKAKDPANPFFNSMLTPKYAQDQAAMHMKHFLDYEKTQNAAAAASTPPPLPAAGAAPAAVAASYVEPPPPPPAAERSAPPPPLPPPPAAKQKRRLRIVFAVQVPCGTQMISSSIWHWLAATGKN